MDAFLSDGEFLSLMRPLGPFEAAPKVAVAVSGGPDSLALTVLANDWAMSLGGQVVAVTVDHRLRPESGDEARRVGQWLAELGIPHHVLSWDDARPGPDMQGRARAARYDLLEQFCARHGILHVLLAHHQDDQAETLMLRLARGSGVDGLSAMAPIRHGPWVRWLRPCLDVPRARLAATLIQRGISHWVVDPSNANPRFARARMRALMPTLTAEGMSPSRLGGTARALGRVRDQLDNLCARSLARWVQADAAGFAMVDPQAFQTGDDVAARLLMHLITALGGGDYAPRAPRLAALLDVLSQGGLGGARTLGGCRVEPWSDGRLLFCRDGGRMAPPEPLYPGMVTRWDGRFAVALAADAPPGLVVGGLGATGWRRLGQDFRPRPVPGPARAGVPALYTDDAIFAVPILGYKGRTDEKSLWMAPLSVMPLSAVPRCLAKDGVGTMS